MTAADIRDAFSIRTSTLENALTLAELEEEYGLTPDSLDEAMNGSARGWIGEVEGKAVGFAMGDGDTGELTVIAVRPEFEGLGIGTQLLHKVESWLFSRGHRELWLLTTPDPNLRAYRLYVAKGWLATGEIIDEDEKFVLPSGA
ncbi:MAG: GNAT family N-acetyltransferase [Pseudomonadota bacterium]